ncbi:hypothetical protein K7X08_002625 [Anisodus acutangulus]|uniref:Uncharacterized protein n=1 Tax=Anisodus acutangulus TaxID=402998 RepID=A0A9Q1LT38_9SOLA|nr:hypothetical protein K7X08_002625 [Anisodus acutangulus]
MLSSKILRLSGTSDCNVDSDLSSQQFGGKVAENIFQMRKLSLLNKLTSLLQKCWVRLRNNRPALPRTRA